MSFDHLIEARRFTGEKLAALVGEIGVVPSPASISVVLFGSWARREYTEYSDDDWAILVRNLDPDDDSLTEVLERCEQKLGTDEKKPGAQQIFGVPFPCSDLTDNIGLDEDTNTNLTRRMLLLLESINVAGDAHHKCWRAVLDAYLAHGAKSHRPPRFLLNDLVRYWRTICVDFEGKHRNTGNDDPKWVSRNAKLRTSRKILFAGGLVPVLLCHLREASEMAKYLTAQFEAPPTDRLAAAFLQQDAPEEGVRMMAAYDRWLALLQDEKSRQALASLRQDTRDSSVLFSEVRSIGREIEGGLKALLFETDLAPLTRQFAVF